MSDKKQRRHFDKDINTGFSHLNRSEHSSALDTIVKPKTTGIKDSDITKDEFESDGNLLVKKKKIAAFAQTGADKSQTGL